MNVLNVLHNELLGDENRLMT